MKYIQLIYTVIFLCLAAQLSAQVEEKTYEITITTTDQEGNKEVKELVLEGVDMSPEEIDELVQEHIDGADAEVDVNVNVNVSAAGEQSSEKTKTITKIIKQRSNLNDEEKIIIEEHDMEIEVIDEKVYINGEEVKDGDFDGKRVRIMKFEDGDEYELEDLLQEENIEIGEGENIYFIEKKETKEGLAFLGVVVGDKEETGGVTIKEIVTGTSAEKIGLQKGDVLISINGKAINNFSTLSKTVKAYLPGEKVNIVYSRNGESKEAMVELSDYEKYNDNKVSWHEKRHKHRGRAKKGVHREKHKKVDLNRAVLGVAVKERDGGIFVEQVRKGSPAEESGIQVGDQIVSVEKGKMLADDQFYFTIGAYKPGDEVKLKLKRDGKAKKVKVTLQSMGESLEQLRGMGQKYPLNKSQRIERIVIKDEREDGRDVKEIGGAIKISSFDLSPNPSNGTFKVNFEMDPLKTGESFTVRIISLDGKVLREKKYSSFNGTFSEDYDLKEFGKGIYLYQIEKQKQTFTKRFVIEDDK